MNFIKHNAHPQKKKTCDCVVRAITLGLYKTAKNYELHFLQLMKLSMITLIPYNDEISYGLYLENHGCKKTSHTVKKGDKRPKVKDFTDGTYILSIANHLAAVVDGELYDTWDCREKAVYKSWKVE